MGTFFETAHFLKTGIVSNDPLKIYTGILGRIGDIIMFTATVRRLRELFPNSQITFAVCAKFRGAGQLIEGLPYIDRVFVAELYFERMSETYFMPWHLGWGVDLRGDDEVAEQRKHDLVLETRPRHQRMPWWKYDHQVVESAHMVRVPGPINPHTEIAIPPGISVRPEAIGRIVVHNDSEIDQKKPWPWKSLRRLVDKIGAENVVLIGNPGPDLAGVLDLRGRTTLAEAARIIEHARCYVGIDSGPMWIAGSLQVPTVGLYATSYIPAYGAIHPRNRNAVYIQSKGTMDEITPDVVYSEVQRVMSQTANRELAS